MAKKFLMVVLACGLGVVPASRGWGATALNQLTTTPLLKVESSVVASVRYQTSAQIVSSLTAAMRRLDQIVPQYAAQKRAEEAARRKAETERQLQEQLAAAKKSTFKQRFQRFTNFAVSLFQKSPSTTAPSTPKTYTVVPLEIPTMTLDPLKEEIKRLNHEIIATVKVITKEQALEPEVNRLAMQSLFTVHWAETVLRWSPFAVSVDFGTFLENVEGMSGTEAALELRARRLMKENGLAGRLILNHQLALFNVLPDPVLYTRQVVSTQSRFSQFAAFLSEADRLWLDWSHTLSFLSIAQELNGMQAIGLFRNFYKYSAGPTTAVYDFAQARSADRRYWSPLFFTLRDTGDDTSNLIRGVGTAIPTSDTTNRYLWQRFESFYNPPSRTTGASGGIGIAFISPYFRPTIVGRPGRDVFGCLVALRGQGRGCLALEQCGYADFSDPDSMGCRPASCRDLGTEELAARPECLSLRAGGGGSGGAAGPAGALNGCMGLKVGGGRGSYSPTGLGVTADRPAQCYGGGMFGVDAGNIPASLSSCGGISLAGDGTKVEPAPKEPPAPQPAAQDPVPPAERGTTEEADLAREADRVLDQYARELLQGLSGEPFRDLTQELHEEGLIATFPHSSSSCAGDEGSCASSSCDFIGRQLVSFAENCFGTTAEGGGSLTSSSDVGCTRDSSGGGTCADMPGFGNCGNITLPPVDPACDPTFVDLTAMAGTCRGGASSGTAGAGAAPGAGAEAGGFRDQLINPGREPGSSPFGTGGGTTGGLPPPGPDY